MNIFVRLCEVEVSYPDLLIAYRDDLYATDRVILAQATAGTEYIWLLRRHGTELFPIAEGWDPATVTFWLQDGVKAFHIRVTTDNGGDGDIVPISHEKARRLAMLPPKPGRRTWVPAGFALLYQTDGRELGRVTNMSGQGWDAFVGRVSDARSRVDRYETLERAKQAVEEVFAIKAAA